MNTLFALILTGVLNTTVPVEAPAPVTTTYSVTDQMAVWVSADRKLHLILGRNASDAQVRLIGKNTQYVQQRISLRKQAVAQRYDIAALPAGTYQLTIEIGGQTIRRDITINEPAAQRIVTLE